MYADSCSSQIDAVKGGCVVFPRDFPIRQAFWFIHLPSVVAESAHHFWLENSFGQVIAVRIRGIGQKNPEDLIPYFAGIESSTGEDQLLEFLLRAWLFPPQLYVKFLRDVPVNPAAVVCDEHVGCKAELIDAALNFFGNLNQKIIKALGTDVSASAYNTVRSWPLHVFRNRLQACEKYPWIKADMGFCTTKPDLPSLNAALLNLINLGKPYERLLAEHYVVDRHALRCVAKLSRNLSDWDGLPAVLAIVDAMKPDFRLQVCKNWSVMLPLLHWCERWRLEADPDFLRQFAKEIFSDGIAGAQRIFRRELPGHNPSNPSFDLEDYLRSLPLGHRQWDIFPAGFGQAFQSRVQACGSVVAVFSESVAWHRGQSDPATQSDHNLTWPPLLDGQRMDFGHFCARELTCAVELSLEGVSQSNCIASYARRCVDGEDFIFSLEHNNGTQPRTTAHFTMGPHGLYMVEQRAYDNDTPCAAAKADAVDLLKCLINRLSNK